MEKKDIENLIKDLIEKVKIPVKKISIDEEKPKATEKTTWFSVEVEEPHHFLDFNGEALFALNHLARRIVDSNTAKEETERVPLLIDINGFQKKRIEGIHAVAHMMAERARYFKSNIEVDPMTAFERRVVHEFLSEAEDLETESQGEGRSRRVVIKYTGSL